MVGRFVHSQTHMLRDCAHCLFQVNRIHIFVGAQSVLESVTWSPVWISLDLKVVSLDWGMGGVGRITGIYLIGSD